MDGYELRHADNLTPNLFLMELSWHALILLSLMR
jgi:hypothetical protein